MVTLLKLGGSLITDKSQEKTLRSDILERIAGEIQKALEDHPLEIIIGHGSGSFGHFEAKRHDTINGVQSAEDWRGFASVGRIAAELNFHVATALSAAGIPIFRVQPSASVMTRNGIIQDMAMQPIFQALERGLVPLVYGDVAFDDALGGTIISTETIFSYLVTKLPVRTVILPGEVDGVLDQDGEVIPHITPENFEAIKPALGGSGGVDVTGGMLTKVQDMLSLATNPPYPIIYIVNGMVDNVVYEALRGNITGTRISR